MCFFVCFCVRLLIGLISAALGGGARAHFPNSGWSSLDWVGTSERCLWLLFMDSGRGLLGEKLSLVNFYRWVIDGYASKHNNHDRLYCGNLRFWPPCVEEDQAWSRDGQVFIGWDAVKVNNTKKKPISSHLDQICRIHYMGKKKLFVVGSTFRGIVWDFDGVHVLCCQFCPFSMVQILFPFVFGYGNIW